MWVLNPVCASFQMVFSLRHRPDCSLGFPKECFVATIAHKYPLISSVLFKIGYNRGGGQDIYQFVPFLGLGEIFTFDLLYYIEFYIEFLL